MTNERESTGRENLLGPSDLWGLVFVPGRAFSVTNQDIRTGRFTGNLAREAKRWSLGIEMAKVWMYCCAGMTVYSIAKAAGQYFS